MIPSRLKTRLSASVALVTLGALAACGIDQGGTHVQSQGATNRTIVVSGPITGFGSVHVNGLTLDASAAAIRIDGGPAAEADLREGQVIRAIAEQQAKGLRAIVIEHEENLVGPIEQIDLTNGGLTVLGHVVRIDQATRFDFAQISGPAGLAIGDAVIVSGFALPADEVLATYIAAAAPNQAFQITSSVTAADIPGLTFDLGDLTVDYSQAAILQLANGVPELGAIVEVKGATAAGGILIADEVRALTLLPGLFDAAATSFTATEQSILGPASTNADLAANFIGFVTDTNLPGRISLGNVDVLLDGAVIIVGGTAKDLTAGTRIQVEGDILNLGQIMADRITIF